MDNYQQQTNDEEVESNPYDDDERSVNSLENPYDKRHAHRQNIDNKKFDALKKWKKRVRIWAILLILCSGVLMYSDIWYANLVGFAAGPLALYGVQKENSEFLFVYLVLLFLELLKNIGVFFYFVSGTGKSEHQLKIVLSCIFVVIEEIVVVPGNVYHTFRLYRTIKYHKSDDDLDETLSNWQ